MKAIFLILLIGLKLEYEEFEYLRRWYQAADTGYIITNKPAVYRFYEKEGRLVYEKSALEDEFSLFVHNGITLILGVGGVIELYPQDTAIINQWVKSYQIQFYKGKYFMLDVHKRIWVIELKPLKVRGFELKNIGFSFCPVDSGWFVVQRDSLKMDFYDIEGKFKRSIDLKVLGKELKYYGIRRKSDGIYVQGGIPNIYQLSSSKFLFSGFYFTENENLPYTFLFIVRIEDYKPVIEKILKFHGPVYPLMVKDDYAWVIRFRVNGGEIWKIQF